MEAYKERMIDEYNELNKRIVKLDKFIAKIDNGDAYTIDDTQYHLLVAQSYAMHTYSRILLLRMHDLGFDHFEA